MRNTQAARYARWAATAAALLAVTALGIYARRAWQAHNERKQAPPSVPAAVQQRSSVFSFSKVEKDRTIFTVRASRATEFKVGSKNLLEDVWITVYGRAGQRYDNIHTQSCEYLSDVGRIICAGEVQMDLESAAEAQQHPGERVIHLGTSNVTFDRESGIARTDRPVTLRFPYGEGRGVGLAFQSREGVLRLEREVELKLLPMGRPGELAREIEPFTITGATLEYRRESHTLRLVGAARARQGQRELTAGEVTLQLDAELRARRLVASREPVLHSPAPRGTATLAAAEFVAFFHHDGWVERVQASGGVHGNLTAESKNDQIAADRVEIEMLPRVNQPNVMTLSGGVTAQSQHRGELQKLEAAALRLYFTQGAKSNERRLDRGETLAPAMVEWQTPRSVSGKSAMEITRLRGQQIAAEFDARSKLRVLRGRNGTNLERHPPGRPAEVTESDEFAARFDADGEWSDVEQTGHVRFREGERSGQAERTRVEHATETITLTGSAQLTDGNMRTTARVATYNSRTAEFTAEGNVSASDLSGGRSASTNLALQPAHITSDHLAGNASSGRAVYSGNARLWQGDSVVEADSIELLRDAQRLAARGNVRAVFLQAPSAGASAPAAKPPASGGGPAAAGGPDLWRVRAGTLTYWSKESRALLEQSVVAESRHAAISSQTLELFLSAQGPAEGAGANGPQQVTRAVATGGASVRRGERRGVADRAEYFGAEGKCVLSGGRPTLYDASRGTTTGRQLTFFFANDTIVVDSEEGSRTLTKHRVEK